MSKTINIKEHETTKHNLNTAMLLMQCIGIIAVVFGHADYGGDDIPNFLNLAFPYYSWHMPFFVFISGYFFNRTKPVTKYIPQKLKTHLLPALIVNFVCGIFSMALMEFNITGFGMPITLKSLFVTPFTTGYQFNIDVALWYVFALVVIEIVAVLMDRVVRGKGDLIYLLITFVGSLLCCYRAYYDFEGTRDEYFNAVLRFGFLMFFFWLGVCYKHYFENSIKRFINYKTSIVIFIVQGVFLGLTEFVININTRNMDFSKITVPDGYWVALVSPISATLFFLGICYSVAPYVKDSKLLVTFGRNTKYVMYYHQLIFVLSSVLCAIIVKLEILNISGFSFKKMWEKIYYSGGNIYITVAVSVIALVLPIVVCRFIDKKKLPVRILLYALITALIVLFLYCAGNILN